MKFRIKDFFSKCEQIRSFLFIRSHLLKKSLMEDNAVKVQFCAVCCLKEVSKLQEFADLRFERTQRNLLKILSEGFMEETLI